MPEQLPLTPSVANYRFSTDLQEVTYVFDIRWNMRDEAWYMDIMDEDENQLLSGAKLVLGALIGLRSASGELPDGVFVVSDQSGNGQEAGFDDMGERVIVAFFSAEELST